MSGGLSAADDQVQRWAAITATARTVRGETAPPVANRGAMTATIICACVMQGVEAPQKNRSLPLEVSKAKGAAPL